MARRKPTIVKGSYTSRRTEGDYLGALLDAVSLEDWRAMVDKAVTMARSGGAGIAWPSGSRVTGGVNLWAVGGGYRRRSQCCKKWRPAKFQPTRNRLIELGGRDFSTVSPISRPEKVANSAMRCISATRNGTPGGRRWREARM